jgi:hypothetical protein
MQKNIQVGDLLFSYPKSKWKIFAFIINATTNTLSKYPALSHVAVVESVETLPNKNTLVVVREALGSKGVCQAEFQICHSIKGNTIKGRFEKDHLYLAQKRPEITNNEMIKMNEFFELTKDAKYHWLGILKPLWKYFIIPFLKVRNFIKKDKPSKKIKFKKTRLEKQIEKGFLCSTFVWYMLYYIGEINYITYVGKVPSPRHLLVYLNKTGKVKPLIKIN